MSYKWSEKYSFVLSFLSDNKRVAKINPNPTRINTRGCTDISYQVCKKLKIKTISI